MNSIDLTWAILFLPLIGVLINGLAGFRLPKLVVAWIGCLVVGAAFVVALAVMWPAVQGLGAEGFRDLTLYQWLSPPPELAAQGIQVPVAIRLDPLSVT